MSLAIVTGANRNPGIGYEIVRGLASRLPTGSKVILTSRIKAMGEVAVQALITQPMMQSRPNQTKLRSMDSYIQILCRFQKSKQKVPPPLLPCIKKG